MAGTLTISTLSDGTNSTSATNPILGSAKAWVNFNGTSAAIRASYNVSSITKISTGNYALNFTNALTDANYSGIATAGTSGTTGVTIIAPYNFTNTTTSCSVCTFNTAYSGLIDIDIVNVSIFR